MTHRTIAYLGYLWRHKREVYKAGRRIGVSPWQLLVHDASKFRPDEFGPYRDFFYGGAKGTHEGKAAFDAAWLKHIHRNPHHWQHWLLQNDDGTRKALPMPDKYLREMVADWVGAGKAIYGDKANVLVWYMNNVQTIQLHVSTRSQVEILLLDFLPPTTSREKAINLMDDARFERIRRKDTSA